MGSSNMKSIIVFYLTEMDIFFRGLIRAAQSSSVAMKDNIPKNIEQRYPTSYSGLT